MIGCLSFFTQGRSQHAPLPTGDPVQPTRPICGTRKLLCAVRRATFDRGIVVTNSAVIVSVRCTKTQSLRCSSSPQKAGAFWGPRVICSLYRPQDVLANGHPGIAERGAGGHTYKRNLCGRASSSSLQGDSLATSSSSLCTQISSFVSIPARPSLR